MGARGRAVAGTIVALVLAAPAAGQSITGTLMELGSDRPLELGFVALLTEDGDSVTATITGENGRFVVSSPEAGSFRILGSALGFKETVAGVFDLGPGSVMNVEFRLTPEPVTLDGLIVQAERVASEPALARYGFYERVERGFGTFITPERIAESTARATSDLFWGLPGMTVAGDFTGDRVLMQSMARWCSPTLYVDGARISRSMSRDSPLESIVPLATVAAIEVYRRPAEIPVQYSMGQLSEEHGNDLGDIGSCGVIVVWTKR